MNKREKQVLERKFGCGVVNYGNSDWLRKLYRRVGSYREKYGEPVVIDRKASMILPCNYYTLLNRVKEMTDGWEIRENTSWLLVGATNEDAGLAMLVYEAIKKKDITGDKLVLCTDNTKLDGYIRKLRALDSIYKTIAVVSWSNMNQEFERFLKKLDQYSLDNMDAFSFSLLDGYDREPWLSYRALTVPSTYDSLDEEVKFKKEMNLGSKSAHFVSDIRQGIGFENLARKILAKFIEPGLKADIHIVTTSDYYIYGLKLCKEFAKLDEISSLKIQATTDKDISYGDGRTIKNKRQFKFNRHDEFIYGYKPYKTNGYSNRILITLAPPESLEEFALEIDSQLYTPFGTTVAIRFLEDTVK